MRQLIAEGVGERRVPLVHQVDRRRDHERGDASVSDRLDTEERLPTPGREHDAASSIMSMPRIERGLLVLARLDLEYRSESEFGVRPSCVLNRTSRPLDSFLLG